MSSEELDRKCPALAVESTKTAESNRAFAIVARIAVNRVKFLQSHSMLRSKPKRRGISDASTWICCCDVRVMSPDHTRSKCIRICLLSCLGVCTDREFGHCFRLARHRRASQRNVGLGRINGKSRPSNGIGRDGNRKPRFRVDRLDRSSNRCGANAVTTR